MKNVFLLCAVAVVCLLVGFSFAPKKDYNARIDKIQGIPVYVMSEPLDDYEVIATENNSSRSYSIRETVDNIVTKIRKKEDRNRIGEFDAIMISSDGAKATLIKYKSE